MKPTEVLLSEKLHVESGGKPIVQVLRTGSFKHPEYGNFEITTQVLAEMVKNFKDRVRGQDLGFDYYHDSHRDASGWVKDLVLTENGTELWAIVDWTPIALKKLQDREIRYFSPDFAFKWQDPETGKVFKNVLFGGGLTNRPFVKEMAAIVANEEGETMKNFDELKTAFEKMQSDMTKLTEANASMTKKLAELPQPAVPVVDKPGDDMEVMKKQLAELQVKYAEAMKENEALKAGQKLAEKKTEFTKLLSEGKACAAQEKAYLGGDMAEFIKLAQVVNLVGKGSSGDASADDDDKVIKLAEEMLKRKEAKDIGDAISKVRAELKAK